MNDCALKMVLNINSWFGLLQAFLQYPHHRQHKEAIVFHVGWINALQVVVGA